MNTHQPITIKTTVKATLPKVWEYWTSPTHIQSWNSASDDWHTTRAENDLRIGGKFCSRMEAKDGSMGFDFSGRYDNVIPNQQIDYTLDDERKVNVTFTESGDSVTIVETFDPESQNPLEMQRLGWQAILESFKRYVEGQVYRG